MTVAVLAPAGLTPAPTWEDLWSWMAGRSRHDDLALVERVTRGDRAAQTQLVRLLLPHLRAVTAAILRRSADVDDAVQIALMRVLENLPSYRGDATLIRWCRKVAAHAALRYVEQNRRHARALDEDVAEIESPRQTGTLRDQLPRPVTDYLDRLPEAQREAVVLRHALDYSVAEIAELTNTAVDTIKSRLVFGRRALRKLIRRDTTLGVVPKEDAG